MTYDPDNTPDYVHKILVPMREYYTNEARGKQELLGSLVKVNWNSFSNFVPYDNVIDKREWLQCL